MLRRTRDERRGIDLCVIQSRGLENGLKLNLKKVAYWGGGGGRARKDSNLWPLESELTDYFGLIVRNLE